jgi:hypothetical protein
MRELRKTFQHSAAAAPPTPRMCVGTNLRIATDAPDQ